MRTRAIVNPNSQARRTGRSWAEVHQRLEGAIGPVEAAFTTGVWTAPALVREALKDGVEQIIAVGGDGTMNEVVNGFFEDGKPINERAVLGMLMSGTGGDFKRTFGLPQEVTGQIEHLARANPRPIDIGKLTYVRHDGREDVRYFNNIASFGLSGAADISVNNLTLAKALLPGKFAFQWGVLKALVKYKNQPVRIRVDDTLDEVFNVATAAVANGKYFGGSMKVAPEAKPDDGLFDVIIMADITMGEQLRDSKSIYTGDHLKNPKIRSARGRRVVATPAYAPDEAEAPVLLDVDGEAPGRLPATFEVLPGALLFRV